MPLFTEAQPANTMLQLQAINQCNSQNDGQAENTSIHPNPALDASDSEKGKVLLVLLLFVCF